MRVRFSTTARRDLREIAEHIATDDWVRASSFAEEIEDRCRSLAEFPDRFPVVYRTGRFALRKLSHADYLIFYATMPDEVVIVRVLHGARDWQSMFDARR